MGAALVTLDINMAVKDLPKSAAPVAAPTSIPLKRITLGGQSIAVSFLRPLFAASTTTLQSLTLTLNSRTTQNLTQSCPTALPHLTELKVDALRNEITHVERAFFPLLSACTKLRNLGWEWNEFYELEGATRHLPDQGARLERIGIGLFGPSPRPARVEAFLKRSCCLSLRELYVVGGSGVERVEMKRVCAERRVVLR